MWYETEDGKGIDTKHLAAITGHKGDRWAIMVGKDVGIALNDWDADKLMEIKAVEEGTSW